MDIATMIGRLHPLVLHLPIGIFFFVFMMECYARWKKTDEFNKAIGLGLFMAASFASLSCMTGWLLSDTGDYAGDLLWHHKWGAILFTILSWSLFLLYSKGQQNRLYFPLLCLSILGLGYVGHKGGSLTHGSGFLWTDNEDGEELVATDDLILYQHLIKPIIKKKCQSCHNQGKKKGKLDMSNFTALMEGGKHGETLIPNKAKSSLMIARVHLPMDDEEHMPPEYKTPLTSDEIALLEWWIDQGASETAMVKDTPQDEPITDILKKYTLQGDGGQRPKVEELDPSVFKSMNAKGLAIQKLSEDSPYVSVDLSHDQTLNRSKIKNLRKVADHLVDLDLAFSNITDEELKLIKTLNNVERLELQGTTIGTKGLAALKDWNRLKVLNVYDTNVDDGLLEFIDQFPALQRIYLWQSEMTKQGMDSLAKMKPLLDIQFALNKDVFGEASLLPPVINAESTLFLDSIRVSLDVNFKGVDVRYTLDGSDPTNESMLYVDELLLEKSCLLRTRSMKKGWDTSRIAERQFFLISNPVKSIQLENQPAEKYSAKGGKSLIDLNKGAAFSDGQWLGFEGEGVSAILDLGSVKSISGINVSALEATASYIFFPKGIIVRASEDGINYQPLATEKYQTAIEPNEAQKNFTLKFDETSVRYLKLNIVGQLSNPNWHPAPGAKSWLFIDEIIVN